MRIALLSSLILATLCTSQAQASSDDFCAPAWKLYSSRLDGCSNLPFLSPGNDSRVNLRLLMADQGSLALVPRALNKDDLSLGFGPVPFPTYRLRPLDPADEHDGDSTNAALSPAAAELNSRLQALGISRDNQKAAGDNFIEGEGSRCRSNSDASALAFVAQLDNPQLSPADRQALAQARIKLLGACSWEANPLADLLPANLASAPARDLASYLQASVQFYDGHFDDATRGFTSLKDNALPWLAETATYMLARTALNQAQQSALDEWGTVNLKLVDKSALQQAGAGFDAYLKTYPQGLYAVSAKGLIRRVHWLQGDTRTLADDYGQQLTRRSDNSDDKRQDDLVAEIDYKLLDNPDADIRVPLLLAVRDLMDMRKDPSSRLTREALTQHKALFSEQPALYDYLQAAFILFVEQQPATALKQLPTQIPAQLDYLAFSQQTLRGLAMQAQQDWKGATQLWLQLLPLAKQPLQREQLELALAYTYERSGQLAKVFAADSPIESAQVRAILLRHVASPELLRQQARQADSLEERNTAYFVLLYKSLTRGRYAAFTEDLHSVNQGLDTSQGKGVLSNDNIGNYLGYIYADGPSLQVFNWNGQGEAGESANYTCPGIAETAATLQKNPKSPSGLLCLAEFIRLNNFDQMPLDTKPEADRLGGTPDQFPGSTYSRLDSYQQVIDNPKASRDERAFALYRGIYCYASSGNNRCGGKGVEPDVRKAWFRQLKTKLGDTQWAQSLRYYW
ncbi:outer membrane assembly lipoprotein YfiO [Pseudomonas sp. MPFS]|uniref:outer membrane assembly lipoprotein YfiO n=1 Tax=Pseudomonas sp. MPFS TaxID=2795724 RepID=UPI001F148CA1|nr:outer membrane assembly lipoprotein YfiO [Pseudomonas sp. MPFS]UMZ12277.1 outer membrane assembly lipoprotein YfiO [Pseudomonas sp. MPFS]